MKKKQKIAIVTIAGFVLGVLIGVFELGYSFWPDSVIIGIVGGIMGAFFGKLIT